MLLGFVIFAMATCVWLGWSVACWHYRELIGGVPVGATRLTKLNHCTFAIMRKETLEGLLWNAHRRTGLEGPQLTVIDGGKS